jgi:hypothetical protein
MSGQERFRKIVDLLNEARDEVEHCAFHSRGNGMSAFACAEALMRDVSLEELARYMVVVEEACRRSWRFTRRSRVMLVSRLLMLLPPASSTLRAAQQRSLSEPPLRFRVVPECAVGFRAGVALGAVVPEPKPKA